MTTSNPAPEYTIEQCNSLVKHFVGLLQVTDGIPTDGYYLSQVLPTFNSVEYVFSTPCSDPDYGINTYAQIEARCNLFLNGQMSDHKQVLVAVTSKGITFLF